ncbi:MAG TPA: hypothetical protein VOA78_09045 [Candidatus Dormibacteraeota bacterium]|nr:hypothetical protein [Candidatus Dormibacteraeota bacterium]
MVVNMASLPSTVALGGGAVRTRGTCACGAGGGAASCAHNGDSIGATAPAHKPVRIHRRIIGFMLLPQFPPGLAKTTLWDSHFWLSAPGDPQVKNWGAAALSTERAGRLATSNGVPHPCCILSIYKALAHRVKNSEPLAAAQLAAAHSNNSCHFRSHLLTVEMRPITR